MGQFIYEFGIIFYTCFTLGCALLVAPHIFLMIREYKQKQNGRE